MLNDLTMLCKKVMSFRHEALCDYLNPDYGLIGEGGRSFLDIRESLQDSIAIHLSDIVVLESLLRGHCCDKLH